MSRGRRLGPGDVLLYAGDDLLEATIREPVSLVEPPPPLEPLPDFALAVRNALRTPLGLPALSRLVRRGARVTVAFDDPCLPLPPMLRDPRRVVLEQVISDLTEVGVRDQDITLVCANGLHRSWNSWELLPVVGPRLWARFRTRIVCYDAEDRAANSVLGNTLSGLLVEVSRLVTEADLVIYVGQPWTEMNGGHKSLACGLATYRCIRQHHGQAVQAASPLMHPAESRMHDHLHEIGREIGRHVPVFQIETVLNNRLWAGPLKLLDLRRRRLAWPLRPVQYLPPGARRVLRKAQRSFYQPAGIWAGSVERVHQAALARLAAARVGPAKQADILVLGLPNMSPYSVYSDMNPLLNANIGLGYAFQFGRQAPLVKAGGHLILAGSFAPGFHRRHHGAYERFWNEVLPVTRDAAVMEAEFEPAFAADPDLIAAYRFGRAYHPAHPFFSYYWMTRALRHLGRVSVAGPADPAIVERLGFTPVATVEEAVALSRRQLGERAEAVVQLTPPVFTVDVQV